MKRTGLIITLIVAVAMVAAITVKLATQEEGGSVNQIYSENGVAGKLAEGMIGITTTNYDEHITNSKGLVVVDYYAPTCGACIRFAPEFVKSFDSYKDKATFGKYDVSTSSAKVADLNIKGTPTTIIFKDGKEVDRLYGYAEFSKLNEKIEAALK